MPPPNERRRAQLTDAAIALLAESGVHGVTHRAVERRAALPDGTASNYFRSRESLLVAAAERIGQLHYADMDAVARAAGTENTAGAHGGTSGTAATADRPAPDAATPDRAAPDAAAGRPQAAPETRERAATLIARSLLLAATTYRDRYLAVFELRLESLRRPAVAEALADLMRHSVAFTAEHHSAHRLDIPSDAVPVLVSLYGGALFTLVTTPPEDVTEAVAHHLAAAIVRAALPED